MLQIDIEQEINKFDEQVKTILINLSRTSAHVIKSKNVFVMIKILLKTKNVKSDLKLTETLLSAKKRRLV